MVFHWYFKIPEGIGFQPHVESRWKIGYIYKGFIQGIQKGKASTTILGFMMEKVNF